MIAEIFRLKAEPLLNSDNGDVVKVPIENLVTADTYSEVEDLMWTLGEQMDWFCISDDVPYTITKTKIAGIRNLPLYQQFNDKWNKSVFKSEDEFKEGHGLYGVKVQFTSETESGKIKKTIETIYTHATSTLNAIEMVNEELKGSTIEYVIRDCKFDKAVALYKPFDEQDLHSDDKGKP